MSSIRTLRTFLLAALVGPALALVNSVLSFSLGPGGTSSRLGGVMSDLVLLLWPFQVVGIAEASLGTGWAIAIAVVANLALFLAIGAAAAGVAKNGAIMLGICLLLFVVVF